jgi:diaminopimelate decarboxylase
MKRKSQTGKAAQASPELWGLERRDGRLFMDGHDLVGLAAEHGTPLHVASAGTLRTRCRELTAAFAGYPRDVRVHYSYKTNAVAGVLRVLRDCGLGAEVVGGYELWLARRLGVPPEAIVLNGPNKTDEELQAAVDVGVGLLVVDGLAELDRLIRIATEGGRCVPIAFRVCPEVVPRGMNTSSAAGDSESPFGFELHSEELHAAIRRAVESPRLRLRGAMAHAGSGIHDMKAFRATTGRLLAVQTEMHRAGAPADLLDVGGGLGTRLSRELTTFQLLSYLGLKRLPPAPRPCAESLFRPYATAVSEAVEEGCRRHGIPLPDLVLEPGRAITSDAQVLLLRVGAVRERSGGKRFALTDGGAMTVSMMFLSEHHTVLLANRDAPIEAERTSVFGRLPSPMDVVYRRMPSPRLRVGDVLAVMDAGAYFTSTSTNFGGPRPPVVLVDGGSTRLVRRRESFTDLARVELALEAEPEGGAS